MSYRYVTYACRRIVLSALACAVVGVARGDELPHLFRDYVAQPDPAFSWKIVDRHEDEGLITLVIDLTSQTWRQPAEVDRTEWRHWLVVVRPKRVDFDTALLFIAGGSNDAKPPDDADQRTKTLARASRSVVAELHAVPNQPLRVVGHDGPLREDALLAYCMSRCIQTGDYTWLPRLPMVKSAVKAMDAVQQALVADAIPESERVVIKKFVVAGGSKRGWTTWLVPTVDARVTAIMPMVIDVLNVRRSMAHHLAAYGKWSPALGDYERQRLLNKEAMDRSHELMAIDDPYTYRSLLTLPKYIVNASGDQYFVSDSSQFYFDALPGEKHLRYVPNADHSLEGSDATESALAFYQFILAERPRPKYAWRFDGDDAIVLSTPEKPIAVRHWQATNADARDFRLAVLGPKFTAQPLTPAASGEYRATAPPPEHGWTAHFIEAEFAGVDSTPWKITSGVQVSPKTLPFAEKAKPLLDELAPSK